MKAKPAVVIGLVIVGVLTFAIWSARQTLTFWMVDATLEAAAVGPVRALLPTALPERFSFQEDGSVERQSGAPNFDPIDVRVAVLPLGVAVAAEDADEQLQSLLASMPASAKLLTEEGRLALVDSARDPAGDEWHTRVVLAGAVLARVDVRVHADAPSSWRDAAVRSAASLRIEGEPTPEELRDALGAIAARACTIGDLVACRTAATARRAAGQREGAISLLQGALARSPPLAGLWANSARAAAVFGTEALESGIASTAAGDSDLQTLDALLSLHRLLGEMQREDDNWDDARKTYEIAWRYDATLGCAEGYVEALANLAASGDIDKGQLSVIANAMNERFEESPRGRILAASLAAHAQDYALAKRMIGAVFAQTDDPQLRRLAVTVPLVAPPKLEPVRCPAGAESVVTVGAQIESYCVKRGTDVRHGPSRTTSRDSGYPVREAFWDGDEAKPPQRFWWENGVLEKETWLADDGSILARRFDPLGAVIEEPPPPGTPAPKMPPGLGPDGEPLAPD